MEILRRVRQRGDTTPVIILTAQDRLDDRLLGLDNGADDYLIKPFALEELSARIRALLRRSTGRAKDVIEHRDVAVDLSAGTVTQNGENIDVSPREFALLRALLEKKGKPVSRELLETLVYSWDNEVESNAVAVHIHNLRRKFGEGFIKTKRGFGYFVDN
jgi:two-component system response regulator QseB